jgi:phosphate:Na+ symporter
MQTVSVLFSILGSLGLFLFGMKVMGSGMQQAAGQRMETVLSYMTGNRFLSVLTGLGVTAIIQSSSATTVMVVSFVNAGLLTLKQAIGVIMGANIGTTVTAWIVSLIGFSLKISALALPAVGIGFVLSVIKWKHKELGNAILGFGLLFMGLDLLTKSMPALSPETLHFIGEYSNMGFVSILLGAAFGVVITLLIHSSSASTAIFLTMAFHKLVGYEMAAAMILGANIGTTIDAALAAIGAKPSAQQAALVHILFNVIGNIWAIILFRPLLAIVAIVTPGEPSGGGITSHLAMFHTVFNAANTIIFLPFVNQFALLVRAIIKDKPEIVPRHYRLNYSSGMMQDTPEFNILRAEKEISGMAGIVSSMYGKISETLLTLKKNEKKEEAVAVLVEELREKEHYADEMRDELTKFLMECSGRQNDSRFANHISKLLRITADLENMTDDCYGVALLLERSVKKDQIFGEKEMKALVPYTTLVGDFLSFVHNHLGKHLTAEEHGQAGQMEEAIDQAQRKLRKYGQKRIEAGKDVRTELLFVDLVRRLEHLGDFCYSISAALARPEA